MSTQNELKIIETFQNLYKYHQKFYQDDLSHQGAKKVSMFIVTLETSSGQQSSLSYTNKERYEHCQIEIEISIFLCCSSDIGQQCSLLFENIDRNTAR